MRITVMRSLRSFHAILWTSIDNFDATLVDATE